MSAFSAVAPGFEAFLATVKDATSLATGRAGDPRNCRFIPRNFLIDERIAAERAANYAARLPAGGPTSFDEWNAAHNRYLEERIFVKPPATHDHHSVPTDDPAVSADTFRSPPALADFQGTDLDTHFIRMIAVADIAWLSGQKEDYVYTLGEQVIRDPKPGNPAYGDLAMILEEVFLGVKCDHRPVFAAFYEDFLDELRDPTDASWPNRLRDRLGLYHLNQWFGPLPRRVFLFRYAVREIPRRRGDADRRPIALPAVLDHRLAEAFCPAPRELSRGQLVNLRENAAEQPVREVLHLFMPFEPAHLFRVGMVTTRVPDYLGPARREHLLWLRLLSEREDYAALTDGDIF
jgi:hypothetical protein